MAFEFHIRNATPADMPEILRVEQNWAEDGRATGDKFAARMARFGEGFFLACVNDREGGDTVIATITSMPFRYDPERVSDLKSWDNVTCNGYLPDRFADDINALYIVSGVIDREYRGHDIFRPMVLKVVELAHRKSLDWVVAGAVIPGLKRYLAWHPGTSAYEYTRLRKGSMPADPLLAMYERIGFTVPDARHIVPEYFPDDASLNHAALVVRKLDRSNGR